MDQQSSTVNRRNREVKFRNAKQSQSKSWRANNDYYTPKEMISHGVCAPNFFQAGNGSQEFMLGFIILLTTVELATEEVEN